MRELLERVNKSIVDDAVAEILREERYNLRRRNKHPWSSRRTRAPFYFRARGKSLQSSFEAALQISKMVIKKLGAPWKAAKTGRPAHFCSKKLASVLLVKHYSGFSFEELAAKLREIRYDCRKNTKKKKGRITPSRSTLHCAMGRIPEEYINEALRILDDWCAQEHQQVFGSD